MKGKSVIKPKPEQQKQVNECLTEVGKVLEKYGCRLSVRYHGHQVMGKNMIEAIPVVEKR